MANDSAYIGTELKYIVTLVAQGFEMDRDNYDIIVSCGNKKKEYHKSDILVDGDDNHILTIDTSDFKKGDLYATTYAYVPDNDFPDGLRTEVDKQKLTSLKDLK